MSQLIEKVWKNTSTIDSELCLVASARPEDAEIALLGAGPIDLGAMPKLRAIFRCGVGVDNIPYENCTERGIQVFLPSESTQEILRRETASFACFLILSALYRNVGNFSTWSKIDRVALRARKVLILGKGSIGSRVGEMLSSFCNITFWDPRFNASRDLNKLIGAADVISLHMDLNPETEGWFDGDKIAKMKPGACLVNTARGAVVSEDALYEALVSGRIVAKFDVFWEEPYQGKLTTLGSDIFETFPHVASHSLDFKKGLAEDFVNVLTGLDPNLQAASN